MSRDSAQRHPDGYLASLRTCYDLYRRHGFQPDEAARLGLVRAPAEVAERHVSKRHLVARQRVLNPPSFQDLTEDKALFYVYCTRGGLPVPCLLGIYFRDAVGIDWDHRPLAGDDAWVDFFARRCPDEFVVKPSRGVYGQGIIFADKRLTGFSAADVHRQMRVDARYTSFVVQECLTNHPALHALNPSRGLQTLRVITFVRDDLGVDVLMAYLKPVVGGNRIDNHAAGRTGNLLCPVDLPTGRLGHLMTVTPSGLKTLSPGDGPASRLVGQTLPLWPEVQDLARRLARAFVPMRAIGWDIAITPGGCVCVEGNARWDPPSVGDLSALRPVLQTSIG